MEFINSVSIAEMDEKHIDSIAELEKLCFSTPWSRKSIMYELHNDAAFYYSAILDGKIVGYAGMHIVFDEGYITNVCTHPDFEGKGIGKMLMSKLFDIAKEKSLAFLTLEVRKSNLKAKGLYKKFGFVGEGFRKDYYKNPVEDAEIMFYHFK